MSEHTLKCYACLQEKSGKGYLLHPIKKKKKKLTAWYVFLLCPLPVGASASPAGLVTIQSLWLRRPENLDFLHS